jgi:hypothetical protein
MIALLDTVEPGLDEGTKEKVEEIRPEAERELGSRMGSFQEARTVAADYARRYEDLRSRLLSSNERTLQMSTIVAQVRAIASQVRYSAADIRVFNSGTEGNRIVALALLQVSPVPECLDLVLEAITGSRSAFVTVTRTALRGLTGTRGRGAASVVAPCEHARQIRQKSSDAARNL